MASTRLGLADWALAIIGVTVLTACEAAIPMSPVTTPPERERSPEALSTARIASQAKQPTLQALAWIDPRADAAAILTEAPDPCLKTRSPAINAGEALFNSPLLLGGQAAKAGLSCGACHRNGRDHPHFVFPGLSGSPGTVDVTHGFFGPAREDGLNNPVPIPDLAAPSRSDLFQLDQADALKAFMARQITEEFQGPQPSEETLDALAAYLQAIDPGACKQDPASPSWRDEIDRARAAFAAAESAKAPDAFKQAGLAALGRIHERFSAAGLAEFQIAILETASRLQAGEASDSTLTALAKQLSAADAASYYDRSTLEAALKQP